MGMSEEGMAYVYGPGPGYAWAPMHLANPPSESRLVMYNVDIPLQGSMTQVMHASFVARPACITCISG